MRATVAALLALLAQPAASAGEERLDGDAFQSLSEGWTLHFEQGGLLYGAEQYLPGRRSLWRFGTEGCQEGFWWEEQGNICFLYDDQPGAQCWVVVRRDGDIFVRMVEDAEGSGELRLLRRDREPLTCPGPDVGV
jgi:hypothetical protein